MIESSQFNGPEESPGYLLWQVSTQWRRGVESALLSLNLTHPQFTLLASLAWITRDRLEVTQAELARHCHADVNMTSQILRSLEKKGYIERHRSTSDVRTKLPRVTSSGHSLLKQAIPLVEKVDSSFFSKLTPTEIQTCLRLFTKLLSSRQ